MGFLDDAMDAAKATGKKVGDWADDTSKVANEKIDEAKADWKASHPDEEKAPADPKPDATEAKD